MISSLVIPLKYSPGYKADENIIFKGIVVAQAISVLEEEPSVLKITCKHEATRLTVGRKTVYYYDLKDSDVIGKVTRPYSGIKTTTEDTGVQHREMVQYYATDWDFIVTRAEANGMLVYTEDDEIKVKKPDFSQEPSLKLLHGATVLNFHAELDARTQFKSVKAIAWQPADQALKEVNARDPRVVSPGDRSTQQLAETIGLESFDIRHAGALKDVELQNWVNAQWLKSQLAKVRGRVRFQGYHDIMPGQMLELGGLGVRFNGEGFITAVRHEIDQFNWETDVTFGMDPKWFHQCFDDVDTMPAEGLLPAVQGLQIGVVTKLEEDPEGENRIRVRIPMLEHPSGEGVWARVATLDAGNERGTFFLPEINDEVIVGFLHGDPRHPVVLGQLNSSSKPAPIQALDTNHEKGIYTREKLKVVFNDETKTITVETPGGQKGILDDESKSISLQDQHGNKIVMDENGITIESSKAINIKASTDLKMEAGTNAELKASAQLKAEGSAGAELKAGGNTVIKGAIVQIN